MHLTRQLLGFGRQRVVARRVVSLNEVVEGMERMLRPLLGEDIALVTALAGDLEGIEADYGQMEQVVMNLALNARDAMRGGGRLTIETMNVRVERQDRQHPGVELPAGDYVRLVVRDTQGGTIGSIRHDFEVPDLKGWRTSTPVLSDELEPKKPGAPIAPVVPARRTFAAGGTLYYQFEVYGSTRDPESGLPHVSAGFSLLAGDGTVVQRVPPAPIRPTAEGRLARLGVVPLEGKPPGPYELVLDLRDEISGQKMEVRERFSIEAPAVSAY